MSTSSSENYLSGLAVFWLVLGAIVVGEALARYNAFGLEGVLYPLRYNPGSMREAGLIEADEYVGKRLRPDISTYFKGAPIHTNRWSWRGQDTKLEKEPGTVRIASLGASITLGSGVSDKETYSHQLAQILSQELGQRVEVINMGVGAYSPYQIMLQYKKYGDRFNPDIVLAASSPPEFHRRAVRMRQTSLQREHALPIYGYLLEHSMLALATREFFNFGTRNLSIRDEWKWKSEKGKGGRKRKKGYSYQDMSQDLAKHLEKSQVPLVLSIIRQISLSPGFVPIPPEDPVRKDIRRLTLLTPNLYLIDIYDSFGREYTSEDRIYPGDQHPNAATHRRFAELIAEELKPFLKYRQKQSTSTK